VINAVREWNAGGTARVRVNAVYNRRRRHPCKWLIGSAAGCRRIGGDGGLVRGGKKSK